MVEVKGARGRAGGGDASRVPLARLFAMAFRSLIDELHQRLEDRGWSDVRPAYGFVLVAARGGNITVNDVAALMGMTKQAASKLVMAMEESGYVGRQTDPGDTRARIVQLTRRGHELLETVEIIYGELEAEWAAVLGPKRVESMRRDLVTVLETAHGGELPAVRPVW